MAFTKITQSELNSRGATTLDNKPQIGAQKLKEEFDAPAKQVVAPAVNRLVDELEAETGAMSIGATVPSGLPTGTPGNLQSIVTAINTATQDNKELAHKHDNKDVLDTITEDVVMDADYVHTDNNYTDDDKALVLSAVQDANYVHTDNNLTDTLVEAIADNTALRHTHGNKTVLDKFSEVSGEPQYDGKPIGGGGGGSEVEWRQYISSGTKIAQIEIDGVPTNVYAPTSGGGGSSSYPALDDLPTLNGVEIIGDMVSSDLKVADEAHAHVMEDITDLKLIDKIEDLDDVSLAAPTDGQGLVFNATTNKWENQDVASAWGDIDNKPFDSVGTDFDVDNGELKLADSVKEKFSIQLNATCSGTIATVTDSTYIGTGYLLEEYCDNENAYVKTRTTVGNTLTIEFSDTVTEVVVVATKKGV